MYKIFYLSGYIKAYTRLPYNPIIIYVIINALCPIILSKTKND